ncbi:MAG: hypothetical protein IT169_07315 [Bryobacterales bacterium]|nr:hypothetical protein [Bryobacterales bacterium]
MPATIPTAPSTAPEARPRVSHLHTFFLFPFAIDRQIVREQQPEFWNEQSDWIDGADNWLQGMGAKTRSRFANRVGVWKRDSYRSFDLNSLAYQDMVFFHPVVRRIFFDANHPVPDETEPRTLLRVYTVPLPAGARLFYECEDVRGRSARVQVTDLRLFIFANGVSTLSIGVEAFDIEVEQALWINEMMRKVCPSSGRQKREGRIPSRAALVLEEDEQEQIIVEETFPSANIVGYYPPVSRLVQALLYFVNYGKREFEQLLDERMIVNTYVSIDPESLAEGYAESEDLRRLLSLFLWVDRYAPEYRYEKRFVRQRLRKTLYTRWAHEGTYYGCTGYSDLTFTLGARDCGEHALEEGFLVHRMFNTRYYLMAMVALFYRATLLDFEEKVALVSKRLYEDQADGAIDEENLEVAGALRGEFLHFSNYWFYPELANKEEEHEHFQMKCHAYGVFARKKEIEEDLDKLNSFLREIYQTRNTLAINRLAMLSIITGLSAVLTGFFGMNFGREFARMVFEPTGTFPVVHWAALLFVTVCSVGALAFGIFLIARNWGDYRGILLPHLARKDGEWQWYSLRKADLREEERDEDEV